MAQHYFPDRRIAYERDGTRVFTRRGLNHFWDDLPRDVDMSYYEMPTRAKVYLNGAVRYAVVPNKGAVMPAWPEPPYETWEVSFFFPEPVNLSGIFIAADDQDYTISVSSDTTSMDDGTWTTYGTVRSSVRKWWQAGQETIVPEFPGFPVEENRRFRSYHLYTDAEMYTNKLGMTSLPGAWDLLASYRMNEDSGSTEPGIWKLHGDEMQAVRALRIGMTFPSDNRLMPSFGERLNIHLYGQRAHLGTRGIEIINSNGTSLTANDLVWGNLLRASTIREYHLPPFRVRNYSATATAEDVVLHLTEPEDQDPTVFLEYDSPIEWFGWRVGSGPWIDKEDFGPLLALDLGTLGPGDVSDPITLRARTPVPGNVLKDGPGQIILDPVVGSWS